MERTDDPITFNIYESPLNPNEAKSTFAVQLNALNHRTAYGDSKSATLGSDRAATAIQACVRNDKIKGLRLWGKVVRPNGKLGQNTAKAEYKRTNCRQKDWKTKITCGADRIITGLRFHSVNANKGFSGLAIRCGKIK